MGAYTPIHTFLGQHDQIVIVIVNFKAARQTIACVDSLRRNCAGDVKIIVYDNGSGQQEQSHLARELSADPLVLLMFGVRNLGFARAHNRVFCELFQTPAEFVLLLNPDTVVRSDVTAQMLSSAQASGSDMVAAKVFEWGGDRIQSLGIALYKCGLAANRRDPAAPLLGPTGGCALYRLQMLQEICVSQGEVFDEDFFCYAEDTDLAFRARCLGFTTSYVDSTLIWHEGAASSGGRESAFVLFHGIRNSLLILFKCWPTGLLFRYSGWIMIMLAVVLIRHWRPRELKVVVASYIGAIRLLPKALSKRRALPRCEQAWSLVSSDFYDRTELRAALNALFP